MRRFITTVLLALSTLLLNSFAGAQQAASNSVPNLIRYSGTLKDAQGAPVTSSTAMGVTFAIYKQQEGGAAVWQETQNVTPDSSGQYNVLLGSTTATGLPDDLFSQQEQRWLGVQIQGEAEQARVMLVSVPYAFKAHEADTLGGLPVSAFLKAPPSDANNDTSVRVPTAVGIARTAAGSTNTANQLPPACIPPCTAGNIPVFTGSTGDLTDSLMSQPTSGASVVNDSGSFNLSKFTSAYQIAGSNVLRLGVPGNPTNTNLFVGVGAGNASSGTGNTFVGTQAGFSNFLGSANTFVGVNAGYYNNDNSLQGYSNSYYGFGAGANNINGNQNTFSGALAGQSSQGSDNTFYGYKAGVKNTGGTNTFIGSMTGSNTTTGSNNIYIGYNVAPGNEGGVIRIGNGNESATFIQGIWHHDAVGDDISVVCVGSTGHLGTSPCPTSDSQARQLLAAQQDVIKTQQEQIQTQGQQIATLQERVSRLESLIAKK